MWVWGRVQGFVGLERRYSLGVGGGGGKSVGGDWLCERGIVCWGWGLVKRGEWLVDVGVEMGVYGEGIQVGVGVIYLRM